MEPFGLEVNLLNGRPTKLDCWLFVSLSHKFVFSFFLDFLFCFCLCVCIIESHGEPMKNEV